MQTRLRISEKANNQLNHLSNRLELRRNIVCRMAVGKSLTINDSVKDYEFEDNKGPEFNRVTLTGDQDLIFKTFIIQHEGEKIDEAKYFIHYFRSHIERGLDILYNEYKKINSPVTFLLNLANQD